MERLYWEYRIQFLLIHSALRRAYKYMSLLSTDRLILRSRHALGLPLEEPGRYKDASFFGKDQYDPSNPLYRYDYWGEPKNSEKSKQERMTDAHNKSIVGKGTVWYEMSYEDAIKQKMQRESNSKGTMQMEADEDEKIDQVSDSDYDSDDDFDFSILSDSSFEFPNQPLVNGTESSSISDEGSLGNHVSVLISGCIPDTDIEHAYFAVIVT
ncbi:hypothetical protein Goari_015781 [Gossypium aridum]|uniref:Uncharacterized protein n=1 Tax=Gossypium aridum TaxID=34290 RepID=A0A7J8WGL4_GOSAI|nr:hypothetical protein [Gossypium aridum]